MEQIDTRNIAAFVAVAEANSFSDAGKILNLTQPAVSKRVAALEHQFGEKLFDRIGKQVVLTEAGNEILPKCRAVLESIKDTVLTLENLHKHVSGTLRIGTSHHIGLYYLPPILRQFTDVYREVELDIEFLSSEMICEKVLNASLELGVTTLPNEPDSHLSCKTLWKDPLKFVCSKQHPIRDAQSISLETLTRYNAILPEKNTYTRKIIDQQFEEKGLTLKCRLSTNYLETIKTMVSVGLGWSCLPASMITSDLREIKFVDVKLQRLLGTVQHRDRTLSNAALAFLGLINQRF